jgi:CheY-like chemotaxis protein
MMLVQALQGVGCERIVEASDGAEALRIIGNGPIDIAITDLMIPEIDGIELIPLLREKAEAMAVILCSSDEGTLVAASAIAEGHGLRLLGSVLKPITPGKLRPLLERYLGGV